MTSEPGLIEVMAAAIHNEMWIEYGGNAWRPWAEAQPEDAEICRAYARAACEAGGVERYRKALEEIWASVHEQDWTPPRQTVVDIAERALRGELDGPRAGA